MTRSKIMTRLTLLLLALLLFEVAALHLNRRALQLVAKEIQLSPPGEPHSSWLVCELINDRITPIRYLAVNDHLPGYEITHDGKVGRNFWCTADSNHWLAPCSSVSVRIPVPDTHSKVKVSIFYADTSLLSGLLWLWEDNRLATTEADLITLPRRQ